MTLLSLTSASRQRHACVLIPCSLSYDQVLNIYQDTAGVLWIATASGLHQFDPDTGQFAHYPLPPAAAGFALFAQDRAGRIWFSGGGWDNRGLLRHDLTTGDVRVYRHDPANSFGSAQDKPRSLSADGVFAVFVDRAGQVWVGTDRGLDRYDFDPHNVAANPYLPPVALTEFRVNNKPAPRGSWAAEQLTLSYLDRAISFDFAALSFVVPNKNTYRYRLEGFDQEWREVGSDRRTAIYTNLPAGSYLLRVQGSNNDGVWSDQEAALKITVTPPWWEAPAWFTSELKHLYN